jgi:transposase
MPIFYLINAEQFFVAPFVQPDEVMIVRYVQPLTKEQRQRLENTMKDDPSFRARSRAHGLLLSAQGTTLKDIARAYQVHRVAVSAWIKHWEQHGAQSWHDTPRSGRPSTLSPAEQAIALQYLKEEPQALHKVVKRFADTTAKRLSLSSLPRLATKARLRGQRGRKSLQSLRDPAALAQATRAREALQHHADQGQIALYDVDASGFARDPTLPSAWPEPKSVIELPARQYGRIHGLGLMHRPNDVPPLLCEDSIHPGVVMACCDALCHTRTTKTVVVIANAAIHTREDGEDRIPSWKKNGWIIKSWPPYAPELNLIESLWRRHPIHVVAFLGFCVSQRVERGVGNHPEPGRIRISNYFSIGTYLSRTVCVL